MRILVGTVEIATMMHAFADGFRRLGHVVTSVVCQRHKFYQDLTYDIDLSSVSMDSELLEQLICEHDVFFFIWGDRSLLSGNADFPYLKKMGKKIISVFCGSDIRHHSAYNQQYGIALENVDESFHDLPLSWPLSNLRRGEYFSDLIISMPNQSSLAIRPYINLFQPIILSKYIYNHPENDIPIVVHAPSAKGIKGTDAILQALERLKSDGIAFDLHLLHGVPNSQVLDELKNADVAIDQLYLPVPGVFGLEAMALGCALASYNREEFDNIPSNRPIFSIDSENISERLKVLLTDKALRVQFAARGRLFVENNHDHLKVTRRISDLIESDSDVYDYYPTFFTRNYTLPAGETIPEEIKIITSEIIFQHGIPEDVDINDLVARGHISTQGLNQLRPIPRWKKNFDTEKNKSFVSNAITINKEVNLLNADDVNNLILQSNKLTPRIFTIETSVACELKCPECALGSGLLKRKKGFMSFEEFKIIADKIRPLKPTYLYLHMYGEPMLNPDIIRIINYASTFSKTNISTNGMAMTKKMAEDLITSGVTDIIVSIDGFSQEVYEAYRRGGDIQKVFTALETLQHFNDKHGNRVVISPQFVVFKHNQHEMEPFHSYCVSIGLTPSFKAPHLRKPTTYENSDYAEFTRKPLPDLVRQRQAMTNCGDPREVFTIQLDGSVIICCYDYAGQTSFGNIFEQDVMEIWNSPVYRRFRWDIISGNAPEFCTNNCLLYLCEKPSPLSFQMIMAMKEELSKLMVEDKLPTASHSKQQAENSCLFLNTYYVAFLNHIYRDNPQLAGLSYSTQLSVLQEACFGDSDFYSRGLFGAGWNTKNLIVNCATLQLTWARENNIATNDLQTILLEQIKKIRPTVVYLQDVNFVTQELVNGIHQFCSLLVAQHASPIPQHVDFSAFDIVITAAPHFVDLFRKAGTACYYQPLAFDPRCVATAPPYQARSIDVSFVGGFSNLHVESYHLFEHLAATTPINFWGYGADTLPVESAIRSRHHGEAWGKEMFKILSNSRITINRHGEIAENQACNMRLYEATGAGTLLITDYKDNLNELFEIGKEVVAYRSPEECAELVNYYLAHPNEAEAIARAGQERTLREHTYALRMAQTATILERHIRYRRERDLYAPPDLSRISYGHTGISECEVTKWQVTAWQDPSIPDKQRALVQQALGQMYKGEDAPAYRVLAKIMVPYITNGTSVLELGCSSGYCLEILEYYLNRRLDYTGVDYSQPMIDMAKDYYPQATFITSDGASLFFTDRKFHIVISSSVLLHVPNWRQHISETVRVADKYVVVSRTPICRNNPTHYMKKYAYDIETVELQFNEAEIIREFMVNGLELIDAIQYGANTAVDEYEVTYLFKRL